ncbi:MAG TPA: MBL fold metallo-hydrolase [Candidatus Eisenbacteria bacterium]|nr:MBL fold metallo-hydrolase [Candidatus Eisenbacteria bacterium]
MRRTGSLLLRGVLVLVAVTRPAFSGTSRSTGATHPVAANFRVERLADGVYAVLRNDPPGMMCDGNSGFVVNDDGVVVIDAPESSAEVLAAIRKVTKKPIRTVINTHWHDDHIIGNQVYRDASPGVEFIAHAAVRDYLPVDGLKAREGMLREAPQGVEYLKSLLVSGKGLDGSTITPEERESMESDIRLVEHYLDVVPGAEIVLPTAVVQDRMTLRSGTREIRILHPGRGHTRGDLVVYLPRERVLFAGDLVVWPIPLVGGDQSHVGDWSATLERVRSLGARTIVPGHGPVEKGDGYLAQLVRLFDSVTGQTRAAVAEGKSLEETRPRVNLIEHRTRMAGDSKVRRALFDMYVQGPAVTSAYRDAAPDSARSR